MIYQKEVPAGIDIWIQKQQKDLYDHLISEKVWNLKTKQYDSYCRVYRNNTDKGYIPEFFTKGNDYKEVMLNDAVPVLSFYGVAATEVANNAKSRTIAVHLVFFAKLDAIGSSLDHRGDVEAHNAVDRILRLEQYGFVMKSGPITGVERVFEEYPGMSRDSIKYKADMHPWHCFRFNLECTYDNTISK